MKKSVFLICLILLCTVLLSASGIAVVSSKMGKTTLRRANKNVKFSTGTILERNDELETGRKSSLGCIFGDGLASLRLFSQTKLRIDSRASQTGWDKELELADGSIHLKHQADAGSLTVFVNKGRVVSTGASFLVKNGRGGKARITVLAGTVQVINTAGTAEVSAGKTADLPARGKIKVRSAKDSDLSPEERAAVEPSPEQDQRSITVPMADPQGRVRYLELVW